MKRSETILTQAQPLGAAIKTVLRTAQRVSPKGGVSSVALLALSAAALIPQARAAEYFVANTTDLQNAIITANTNNDTDAVIKLTADITVATALASPTVSMQIDTQGFTLGGISFTTNYDHTLTLSGTIVGAANARGLATSSTSIRSSIVNNGSITGGPGNGIIGVYVFATDFENRGTVKGGDGGAASNGGIGVRAWIGTNITNHGLIEGGDSGTGGSGSGITMSSPAGSATLTNYGTIRGGQTSSTSISQGVGVHMQMPGGSLLTNAGTIEGGSNSVGITVGSPNQTIVNSGHIRGGLLNASANGDRADAITTTGSGVLTLELLAGSNIEGNVIAGSTLNDTLRLSGTANGSFDISQYRNFDIFEKTGGSTWTLTGNGTTPTPWQILQGTLQIGDGGTSGSIIGDITNNGTLAFDRSDASSYDGVISGSGVMRQLGSGSTLLTGAGSTVSTLDVQSGSLELANGASLSVNATTIAAGAMLRNAGTFEGTATDDTLMLAGTLIGSVNLLDGNDQVRIDSGADFSQGTFDGGAGSDAVELTNAGALTLPADAFNDFESLIKHGSGALTLESAVNGFAENITIAEGSVNLHAATVQTNEFRIESGTTLTGVGSFGGNFHNAGVLSPGHSPGVVRVGGNYVQASSGTLISEILPSGTDRLDVAGTAALAGTHRINVQYGLYLDGTTHTLIQADGGITGNFASVEMNQSALITAARELSANALTVSFARVPITGIADPNSGQGRFAEWLENEIDAGTLSPTMTDYVDTLLQQPTIEDARALLGERGEPVASMSQNSVSILGAGFVRTVFDRFTLGDSVQCGQVSPGLSDALNCFWGQGKRQWGQAGGGSRHDWTSDGGQIGVDRNVSSQWTVGATFGYADTGIRDLAGGRNELRTKLGGLYASFAPGRLNVGMTAFYSGNESSTRRNVTVGSSRQQARADFDNDSYGAGIRASYRLTHETGPLVRPFIEAFYDHIEATDFSERNAGSGNLAGRVHERDGLRGTLGVQLAHAFEGYGQVLRPALDLGVTHQFEDDRSRIELRPFSDMPAFDTVGPALDRTAYIARVSLNVSLGRNASVALAYGGEFADDYEQQDGNLSFRIAW
ncbi:autotransporter domain-containing protein [Steroidobacter flavus]|uniref:Autotransporter domain-containing protein n=1 Tax=Steroidobacter flavus TaxID=1842136 RepID=A0ABV8T526_9GAMM